MTPALQTERLLLRPLRLEDAEQVQRIFPQWEIVQYLNGRVPWPYPPDGVISYYRDVCFPAIERGDEWDWTLRLKSSPDQIIGAISFIRGDKTNRGFWLAPEFHNRGLMTEAVIAVNDFWFDVLGFTHLRVPKAVGNITSRRISEKTGMRLVAIEENHPFVCGSLPAEIWELTAHEWHAFRTRLSVPSAKVSRASEEDDFIASIADDVLTVLESKSFFARLDDALCPADGSEPTVACAGDCRQAQLILQTLGFSQEDQGNIFDVLRFRGGFCDCEILHNASEQNRLKATYWREWAKKHSDRVPGRDNNPGE